MKKRLITATAITGTVLLACLVLGRMLGWWQLYTIPSPSNDPAIKQGNHIIASNLKKIELKSFITFLSHAADSMSFTGEGTIKKSHYVFRLCGVPGDILQMKNGTLFVNDKNFDIDLDLKNEYKIANKDIDKIDKEDVYGSEYERQLVSVGGDSVIVTFRQSVKKKYITRVNIVPLLLENESSQSGIFKWYNGSNQWSADNFGPLKVPAGCCFVLGDNRHNALDSRYTGFVALKDITGVVFYKY